MNLLSTILGNCTSATFAAAKAIDIAVVKCSCIGAHHKEGVEKINMGHPVAEVLTNNLI